MTFRDCSLSGERFRRSRVRRFSCRIREIFGRRGGGFRRSYRRSHVRVVLVSQFRRIISSLARVASRRIRISLRGFQAFLEKTCGVRA